VQRRAGFETKLGNHSLRATGITAYLKNGATLEKAATMANHASTRTTQLYDRRRNEVSLDEIERIAYESARGRSMPIKPSQEHFTRLSLARYLLRQAEQQLSAPAPVRCVGLLPLHDCLELFLDTAAEAVGAPLGSRREFRDYWSSLAATSPPIHPSIFQWKDRWQKLIGLGPISNIMG
jgi:hypothetical protein